MSAAIAMAVMCSVPEDLINKNSQDNLGAPISRLASRKTPIRRLAFPGNFPRIS